jgi:hypothetical protein
MSEAIIFNHNNGYIALLKDVKPHSYNREFFIYTSIKTLGCMSEAKMFTHNHVYAALLRDTKPRSNNRDFFIYTQSGLNNQMKESLLQQLPHDTTRWN